jgi:hypothetical protein
MQTIVGLFPPQPIEPLIRVVVCLPVLELIHQNLEYFPLLSTNYEIHYERL